MNYIHCRASHLIYLFKCIDGNGMLVSGPVTVAPDCINLYLHLWEGVHQAQGTHGIGDVGTPYLWHRFSAVWIGFNSPTQSFFHSVRCRVVTSAYSDVTCEPYNIVLKENQFEDWISVRKESTRDTCVLNTWFMHFAGELILIIVCFCCRLMSLMAGSPYVARVVWPPYIQSYKVGAVADLHSKEEPTVCSLVKWGSTVGDNWGKRDIFLLLLFSFHFNRNKFILHWHWVINYSFKWLAVWAQGS